MAYDREDVALTSTGDSESVRRRYTYNTDDTVNVVLADDYFISDIGIYNVGDNILVNENSGIRLYDLVVWFNDGTNIKTAASNSVALISVLIPDISTADDVYANASVNGTIIGIDVVIDGTIATANAVLSFEIDGTPITGGDVTVLFSGSVAGSQFSSTPSAANLITTAPQVIKASTDGASTGTVSAYITFRVVAAQAVV